MKISPTHKYREWTEKSKSYISDTYSMFIHCNNCYLEHRVDIKRGTIVFLWLFMNTEECRKCGCTSFSKSLFQ